MCHDSPPGKRGLAKSRVREISLKRNRAGELKAAPNNEIQVRFRSGVMGEILNLGRIIPWSPGQNQEKLGRIFVIVSQGDTNLGYVGYFDNPTFQNYCRLVPHNKLISPRGGSCQTQNDGGEPLSPGIETVYLTFSKI
jgi:hypothetical protein